MPLASSVAGTIPSWILVALALIVAWRISRGGGGSAVSELSKANEVLTKRKDELGTEVRDLRSELAEMRGRTDFAAALAAALVPILEWTTGHETRAQERHEAVMKLQEAQLVVIQMVADALGPIEGDRL